MYQNKLFLQLTNDASVNIEWPVSLYCPVLLVVGSSIGLLSDVKTKIANANKSDSVTSIAIINLDSLNKTSADSMALIEKQYSVNVSLDSGRGGVCVTGFTIV